MGRYKLGPNGGYYDPNDSGPDQFTPTPGQQVPGMPTPPQQSQPDPGQQMPPWMKDFPQLPGPHKGPWMPPIVDNIPGYDPNQPPHEMQPWQGQPPVMSESMPDGMGGYRTPGGHFDKDGNLLPDAPMPDMSGWARKQYPGGQGGPVPPWMQGGGQPWLESPAAGGSGRYDSTHPPPIAEGYGGGSNPYQSLSSLGGKLGGLLSGGNIQPKQPSGGLAGAIFNKYPDLFKR